MKHVKLLRLNEEVTQKELLELLNGATHIDVDYLGLDKKWGCTFYKNGKKYEEGGFNTNPEVHKFLIDNDIEYNQKDSFLNMKRYRDKEIAKVPFERYQKELLTKGLENIFDLD